MLQCTLSFNMEKTDKWRQIVLICMLMDLAGFGKRYIFSLTRFEIVYFSIFRDTIQPLYISHPGRALSPPTDGTAKPAFQSKIFITAGYKESALEQQQRKGSFIHKY